MAIADPQHPNKEGGLGIGLATPLRRRLNRKKTLTRKNHSYQKRLLTFVRAFKSAPASNN